MLLAGPQLAKAADIRIDDTDPSEMLKVRCHFFELGFSVSGIPLGCGSGAAEILLPETGPITFAGSWIAPASPGGYHRTIYFVEGPGSSLISDIFEFEVHWDGGAGHISGMFVSDSSGPLGLLPAGVDPADIVVEVYPSVTFSFDAPFLTGGVSSDGEKPVPEPATLLLLGSGLSGIALRLRKKRAA
jgi:hypothetical protein